LRRWPDRRAFVVLFSALRLLTNWRLMLVRPSSPADLAVTLI
jgi:hypothetical protein